ncbi:MAG: 6-pyruvoyl-tetrahydropterin synthase-related protein [Anaerolineae bacterium]
MRLKLPFRCCFANADPYLLLVLIFLLPALLPLTAPGYFFNAHDGHHSVFWLVEFDAALRDGAWWPVWAPDHVLGFGYPLWLVYAPLAYYVAEMFHLLGLGFVAAVKAGWALWFLVGALGVYRLARRWWGAPAALVAALAYTYAPYHLVDIYVRAAYAEFAALALAPWALLGLVHLWPRPGPRRAAAAALALAALLLTHSMAPAVFMPFVAGWVAWKVLWAAGEELWRRRPRLQEDAHATPTSSSAAAQPGAESNLAGRLLWTAVAFALGIGMALIFWLPALLERGYIQEASWLHGTYQYVRHFVYPGQLFGTFWGFGFSVPGPADGMSFALGLTPWLTGSVAAVAVLGWPRPALRAQRAEALFFVLAALIALFIMTPAAAPGWAAFPLAASVQFPWRFLAVTTIALALLAAAAVHWLDERTPAAGPFAHLLALLIVLAGFPYTQPELVPVRPADESPLAIVEFEAKYPDMRGMTSFAQRHPSEATSPLIAQYTAGQPLQRAAIIAGNGAVLEQSATANAARARVRVDSDVRLRFYTNYFPGWQATVDGRPTEIAADPPDGLIGLDLPPGEHEVRLRFTATPVRRIGMGLSIGAALGVVGLLLWGRKAASQRS